MAWDRTYSHNMLLALDMWGAAVFWNRPDITISSMCGLVMLADQHAEWRPNVEGLKLYRWQIAVLRFLGPILNRIQANHCQLAIYADIQRAQQLMSTLTLSIQPPTHA